MSETVNIWYGGDLKNDGGFTLNSPSMGTPLDDSKYYEVMNDPHSGNYSLQEWSVDYATGAPVWTALGNPQPATTTNTYTDEADMISSLNSVGAVPAHSMMMDSVSMEAPIYMGSELASQLSGTFNETYYALFEKYNDGDGSYEGLEAQAVESNDGGITWGPLNGDAPMLMITNSSIDLSHSLFDKF